MTVGWSQSVDPWSLDPESVHSATIFGLFCNCVMLYPERLDGGSEAASEPRSLLLPSLSISFFIRINFIYLCIGYAESLLLRAGFSNCSESRGSSLVACMWILIAVASL